MEKLYRVVKSKIHNKGVFAVRDIKKGTRIFQYLGERISKEEGDRRSDIQAENSRKNPEKGEVYVFELNDKYDIDGDVPENDAKYINHSCRPNCEVDIIKDEIWIISTEDIKKGEELTYDYSYDLDYFSDCPCNCQADNCFGYILDSDLWKDGVKILKKKKLPYRKDLKLPDD